MKPINPIPALFAIILALVALLVWLVASRAATPCKPGQFYRVSLDRCVTLHRPTPVKVIHVPAPKVIEAQAVQADPPADAPNWYSGFRWRTLTMEEASHLTDDELHEYGVEMLKHGEGQPGDTRLH